MDEIGDAKVSLDVSTIEFLGFYFVPAKVKYRERVGGSNSADFRVEG